MSAQPWVVLFPGMTADAPVYANKEAALAMIERTREETAGNVDAVAMPLHLAVAAPKLLEALRIAVGHQREFAARLPIGHSPVVGTPRDDVIASMKANEALLGEVA